MTAYDPWNEIIPGIYQGGGWADPGDNFAAVLTLAHGTPPPKAGVKHKEFLFHDAPVLPNLIDLEDAVAWVWQRWFQQEPVLVRCYAGINRSGLVVAKTLMMIGSTPIEAINLVREKRSLDALFNPVFYDYLLSHA